MQIKIIPLELTYCNAIAEILSYDEALHKALAPNSPLKIITDREYYDGCRAWEERKNGRNFMILCDNVPIGSISYYKINKATAGCGYYIKSELWGKGYGTEVFALFLQMIKAAGFQKVTASILKDNEASLKLWTRYTTDILETQDRYTPTILL